MLGKWLVNGAKLRFALWAVGQAMPDPSVLKPYLGKALLAIVAAAACGMLATLSLIFAALGIYFYYTGLAGEFYTAIWVATGTSLLFALVMLVIASKSINQSFAFAGALKAPSGASGNVLDDAWNTVLTGFLNGILTPEEARQSQKPKRPASTPEPVIVANADAKDILHNRAC